jgi:hypothetical protein
LTPGSGQKKPASRAGFFDPVDSLFAVTFLETIDTATGVQNLVLSGVKRVRGTGNLDLYQRVLVTVFPLDGFLALDR